jgi:Reverse transcriptase (RNA-dependent DNA polymerase)
MSSHSPHDMPSAATTHNDVTQTKIPSQRHNRTITRKSQDPNYTVHYGTPISISKPNLSLRILFQNIKGLSHYSNGEDYEYYLQHLRDIQIDIAGLSETNTAWQHQHLRYNFSNRARKAGDGLAKISYGSPTKDIEAITPEKTFQAGGSITLCLGSWTTTIIGKDIQDPTGLGRWSGLSIRGKHNNILSLVTAYRTCDGSRHTAPLGSTFHRETEFFINEARDNNKDIRNISARQLFLTDMTRQVQTLLDAGHAVLLMLDANSTLTDDGKFRTMAEQCGLTDLHRSDPAPSTYIGTTTRRIDYMLGCPKVLASLIRQGSLAYQEGPQSDHRALYVDLNAHQLLEHHANDNSIQPAQARVLKTGNPEAVSTYLTHMTEYYTTHNMIKRINKLHKKHRNFSDDKLSSLLEKWDRDQGRAMQLAEGKTGHSKLKKHYWSPTLRNAGILCRYWNIQKRAKTENRDMTDITRRLQNMVQQHDPTFSFPMRQGVMTVHELDKKWKEAKQTLKQLQKEARELRYRSYEELLATYESDRYNPESTRRAKIIRSTIRTEKCRELYRQIRISVKPLQEFTGGLNSILIPQKEPANGHLIGDNIPDHEVYHWLASHPAGPTRWNTVMDRPSVERYLLQYNRSSFRAAAASPCGRGKVIDDLTFSTLSNPGKDLLEGTVPSEWYNENDLLREFLSSFSTPQSVRESSPIHTSVEAADVKRGFGKWRETTTTSPSGRHLGHYRAIIQDETLLSCLTKFLDIVVQRGISLSRWQNAINVMIEKDAGCPRLNRLRIIHLFEADFNFVLKLLWGHRLVRRAHDLKLINSGQYGSVPGKTAIELVMLNQLSNDICRTNKYNIIRFDNDASACYDRILVPLGMLAARRCGMPDNAIQVHADTLQKMKYKVKTVFGTSDDHYTSRQDEPLFGTGQGSGASPAVWLTLVVVLMNTLDRITKERITFRSPDTPEHHKRLTDAFVDDTSLAITDTYAPMKPNEMIRSIEQIAQNWERLLFLSGGSLNLKKCSWSMIHWEWKHGRPAIYQRQEEDADITLITKSTGTVTKSVIKYNAPNISTRLLGVHINPVGDFTEQLNILRKKSDSMATRIQFSRITPENMLVFLRTMYAPSMLYPLPAVATDEENLAQVQSLMITTALQKMGASKTTPTAIRHGPLELGGLNLIDLRTELGICNLKFLRTAIYTGSEAGKLIIMSLKYTQLEAGVSYNLLQKTNTKLQYITPTWATSVRQYLYQHNISVNITDTLRIRFSNKFDRCIMETEALQRYSPKQQRDINLVRLYIQAVTLSDMSTPDGETIHDQMLQGQRRPGQHIRANWPRQSEPSTSQRRLWRKFIESTYLRYGQKWRYPLGLTLPFDRAQSKESPSIIGESTTPGQESTSLREFLSRLPRWHTRLLSIWHQEASDLEIWRAFRSRQRITIASDGGLKRGLGTLGWKIVDRQGRPLFSGSGPVDGPYDISHSTRSELGGLTAPMLLVLSIAKFWGLQHRCRYKWITDSKAAISKVTYITTSQFAPRRYPDDVDYVTAIHELHRALGGRKLRISWIKGHQDEDTDYEQLSRAAQLNVDADQLASDYYWAGKGMRPTAKLIHLKEYLVTVAINGDIYPTRIDEQIRYHINGSYMKEYLKDKHGWSESTWGKIDINAFGRHFKSLTGTRRVQHMKFVHNLQPIGANQTKIQSAQDEEAKKSDKCPCCLNQVETQFHLLQCKSNPAREKAIKALTNATKKSDGTNKFTQVLGDFMAQWLDNPDSIPSLNCRINPFLRYEHYPPDYIDLINTAIEEQTEIGWLNLFRGFFSRTWHVIASSYFSSEEGAYETTNRYDILTNRHDGANRTHRVLKLLYSLTREIWLGRNDAMHGTENVQTMQRISALDQEITRYHSEPDLVLTSDQFYCETSLQRLLKSSTANKRRWLIRVKASRARKAKLLHIQPRITKFFPQNGPGSRRQIGPCNDRSTKRNHSTQQLMTQFYPERDSNSVPSARNKSTQQLLTNFLRERASNRDPSRVLPASPTPTIHEIG